MLDLNKIQNILYIAFLAILIWQLLYPENSLMGKPEASFEIDGNKYVISNMGGAGTKDPETIKTLGTRLACDSLNEITGQSVVSNGEIDETSSFLSNNKLVVDCMEPMSKIAVDYLPKELFNYDPRNNLGDVYEFYDRAALNQFKKSKLAETDVNYITIPYTVDHCKIKDGKKVCEENPPITERKKRIKDYITRKIRTS
jgi:hypothetical protein